MVIAIDGPVGSGKTTLTSELAFRFGGIGLWYSDVEIHTADENEASLVNRLGRMKQELRDAFKELDPLYKTHAFFLFNLMRLSLARSSVVDASKPIFIDTYWDPLWVMETQYYNRFFEIMCEFMPVPDISLFLKVDEEIGIKRADHRDENAGVIHTFHGIKEKRDAFIRWAYENIPHFNRLHADRPVIQVVEKASEIIQKKTGLKSNIDEKSISVTDAPRVDSRLVTSLRNRIIQKRG